MYSRLDSSLCLCLLIYCCAILVGDKRVRKYISSSVNYLYSSSYRAKCNIYSMWY